MNKIEKGKIFHVNFILQRQNEKMARKWPHFTKWSSVFFHGQRISKLKWPIWQPCSGRLHYNLRNKAVVTFRRFSIITI